jgi:hypothetical protein
VAALADFVLRPDTIRAMIQRIIPTLMEKDTILAGGLDAVLLLTDANPCVLKF